MMVSQTLRSWPLWSLISLASSEEEYFILSCHPFPSNKSFVICLAQRCYPFLPLKRDLIDYGTKHPNNNSMHSSLAAGVDSANLMHAEVKLLILRIRENNSHLKFKACVSGESCTHTNAILFRHTFAFWRWSSPVLKPYTVLNLQLNNYL